MLSCIQLSVTPWTVAARLLCPWNSSGKNTGVGCHFLLHGIFLTQGSNLHVLCLLHCRQILYPLSHPGRITLWYGLFWRRKWQPTSVFFPGEYHGQRNLAGYSPWGCKSWTRLSEFHYYHYGLFWASLMT